MKTKSVRFFQALMVTLCAICAMCGIGILSFARAGDAYARADVDPNYVQAHIFKHTAIYNGTEFGDINSEEKEENSEVVDGKYVLLDTPALDGDILTWYSVRFVLGGNENYRALALTAGTIELNGEKINATVPVPYAPVNQKPYDVWTQDISAVIPCYFAEYDDEGNPVDENSKEYKADTILKTYSLSYTNHTPTTTLRNKTISEFGGLEGQYTLSYTYAPNSGTQPIPESFSFYLLTSESYDINANVFFDNVDNTLTGSAEGDSSYRTQNYFQFTNNSTLSLSSIEVTTMPEASAQTMGNVYKYTGDSTALYTQGQYYKTVANGSNFNWVTAETMYPTLSFNPEKYQISYLLTQYNYEQNTALAWTKTNNVSTGNNGEKIENIVVTLTETNQYNNGTENVTNVYALSYTKTTALNGDVSYSNEEQYTENGKAVTTTPVIRRNGDNYTTTLTFRTPGSYTFYKKLLLKSGSVANGNNFTTQYNLIEQNDITTSNDDFFKNEALRLYGYTATYAYEGTTQLHLYNENYVGIQYVSDFSFLLENAINTNDFNGAENGSVDGLNNGKTLEDFAELIEDYLTNNTSLVRASTNQGPVIVSSNFYMPNLQSVINGYYFNTKTLSTLGVQKVNKNTRFVDSGIYYVLLQTPSTANLVSNDSKAFVYQLLSFEITNSPVTPTIYKTNQTTIQAAYSEYENGSLSNNTMQDKDYTNQNVFLLWTTPSPFDRAVTVQYYFSTAYKTDATAYSVIADSNLNHVGNITYTNLYTSNAFYKFKITSNKNTTAYYSFYIDKMPISNIQAYNTKMEDGKTLLNLTSGAIDYLDSAKTTSITNKQFGWNWSQKVSGAKITATRYFASIGATTSYTPQMLSEINAITTNGTLGAFGDALTYRDTVTITEVDGQKIITENSLSPSQILKNAGVYVLYLCDSAGNTASFVTVLDNTSPTLYVTDTNDAPLTETFLSDNARVHWQEFKAIKISTNDTTNTPNLNPSIVQNGNVITASFVLDGKTIAVDPSLFSTLNSTGYIVVQNSEVKIFVDANNETVLNVGPTLKYIELSVDKNDDTPNVCITVPNQTGSIMTFSLKGIDASYTFTLYDQLANFDQTTLTFSLDQSGIQMFSFKDNTTNFNLYANNSDRRWVPDTYGTNRNIIALKWQTPTNQGVVIKEIVLKYYPLLDNLQTISSNYPYSDTPTTITIYDINDSSAYIAPTSYPGDIVKYLSPALMTVSTPTLLSQPGKYVITRSYTDTFANSGNTQGDIAERNFVFYVDRNDLINKNYAAYTISYGYPTSYYPSQYEGYGQKTSTTEMLSGNNNNFVKENTSILWSNLTYVVQGTKVSVSIDTPIYLYTDDDNSLSIQGFKYTPTDNANNMLYASQYNVLELMSKYINSLKTVVCVQHNNNNAFTKYYTYNPGSNSDYLDLSQLQYAFNTPGNYRVLIFDRMNAQSPITNSADADMTTLTSMSSKPNHVEWYFEISNNQPSGQFMSKNNIESNYNIITASSITEYNTNNDYVIFTFSDPANEYDAQIAYKDVQISGEYSKFGNTVKTDALATLLFDATKKLDSIAEIENITVSVPTLYYYGDDNELKTYYVVLPYNVTSSLYNNAQLDCSYSITLHYIQTTTENEFSSNVYSSTSVIYIDHTAPYTNLYRLIDNDKYLTDLEALYPGTKTYIKQHIDDPNFEFLKHYVFTVNEDFYLTYNHRNDTNAARYRTYGKDGVRNYDGTTYTEITKGFYPTNSPNFYHYNVYYEDGTGGDNLDAKNKITNSPLYRPFKAGNYYDIIESDRSENYRAYTIYVTGNQTTKPGADSTSNLITSAQDSSTLYATLGLTNLDQLQYFGLNGSNSNFITNSATYSNLTYYNETFKNIATSLNSELYSQIIKYTINSQSGSTTYTIVYYRSEEGAQTLQQTLNLANKTNIIFVSSKQDLLDTLNSIIVDAYNTYQYSSGSKIQFQFMNKLSNNPYYSVSTRISKGIVVISNKYVQLDSKELTIVDGYNLTINTRGIDIVNSEADFVTNTSNNSFTIKIPNSNVSTYITSILVNNLTEILDYDSTNDTYSLNTSSFSLSQSYSFKFIDNFGVSKTFTYPIDSQYAQALVFKDGSSLHTYNLSTYKMTCGDTQFVYDSNHLRYLNVYIEDMSTNTKLLHFSNYGNFPDGITPTTSGEGEETTGGEGEESSAPTTTYADDLAQCTEFLTTTRGTDGSTTISFITFENVCYRYTIEVGSDVNNMDNPTKHIYLLYTIFPTVTVTDGNGANMLSDDQELITSKDLLIGLIPNSKALYNPVAYLVQGNYQTPITADADILINQNGSYKIILQNDIGSYSNGTINFTRKSYDISIYGVYYKSGEELKPLIKKNQSYRFTYQLVPEGGEGEGTESSAQVITKVLDRYMFISSNANSWNNIAILLNENKQLKWEKVADDTANNTRIYRVYSTENSAYNIETYFAVTRIPTATGGIVDDFRINDLKPQSSNLTQLYPTVNDTTPKEAVLTWTSTFSFAENSEDVNNKINDFYVVDLWLDGTFIGTYTSGTLRLYQSGTYTIKVHDILGQYKTFSNSSTSYNISIYRDVVYSVNDNHPIQNATFNNDVTITISNINQYRNDFDFSVTRNSNVYDATLTNGSFTFTEAGVYIVQMTGTLNGMGNNVSALTSEYRFSIISSNEARLTYEFSKKSGYTITSIYKNGELMTDENGKSIAPLYSLSLNADNDNEFGKGKYQITVSVKGEGLIPTMTYTYDIWINNETAILNNDRDWGTASIRPFTIKLNPSVVYSRIGNCYITVNGKTVLTIDETNSESNEELSFTCSEPGVYVVQMYSQSGNLISSQRITINEPLNTVAIALISIAAAVVVGLIIMFVVIRKRQKVK